MGLVEFAALIFIVLTARWWLPVVIGLGIMAIGLGLLLAAIAAIIFIAMGIFG